ncbi:MAG: flagellar hook-basal body protein [Oscillospiraceae bacterium]|nr:flagellar hook-basal body protein [Oscillospiraceae bacterium]
MVRGFYTAGSGMITSSRKLDIAGENISNSSTSGYKKDEVTLSSFEQQLISKISSTSDHIGNISLGQTIRSTNTDFEQGAITQTDNPFDLAISGDGFFTVQGTDNKTYYTRNGEFKVDDQGYVTTADGAKLMGNNGAVNSDGQLFTVSSEGGVYVRDRLIDNLTIYNPTDTSSMVKYGNGMFTETGTSAQKAFTGSIGQGCIESSNVSMMDTMMGMMAGQNAFTSCSQAVKMIDETLEQAVNIGRMN